MRSMRNLFFILLTLLAQGVYAQGVKVRALDYEDDLPDRVDSFRTLHIVVAGNIYKTEEQIRQAYDSLEHRYDFSQELRHVNPIMNIGDVVIAQMKTSFTGDIASPYSAPDEFALSIKYTGINQCVLANKNTINIDKKGLLRTQRALGVFDIQTTGAFTDNFQRTGNCPLIVERKGFKVAILNYANIDKRPSVSLDYIVNQIDLGQIERDMKIARDQRCDYIIVYFDWGENYQDYPSFSQEQLAKFVFEQGANLIVGTFPNTIQKIDMIPYYYQAVPHNGMVAYSLGNLVSGYDDDRTKSGALLDIEIHKNNFTGEVKEGDFGFIPVWNYFDTINGKKRLRVIPVAAVEQGDVLKKLPEAEKKKMIKYGLDTRRTMGRYSDEIQYNITDITIEDVEESAQLTNAPMNNRFNPFDQRNLKESAPPVAKNTASKVIDTIYRIQFYELSKLIPIDTTYYEHLKGYEVLQENGTYKYLLGNSTDFAHIKDVYLRTIKPRYKQSLIAVYYDGRRIREIVLKEQL